ncbi:MAG: ankyrin repeat domain-containing protein [Oligoflexia bacterium]|nr:ankyrin repeat domain-containing protein [Oligoflexia bacterium]
MFLNHFLFVLFIIFFISCSSPQSNVVVSTDEFDLKSEIVDELGDDSKSSNDELEKYYDNMTKKILETAYQEESEKIEAKEDDLTAELDEVDNLDKLDDVTDGKSKSKSNSKVSKKNIVTHGKDISSKSKKEELEDSDDLLLKKKPSRAIASSSILKNEFKYIPPVPQNQELISAARIGTIKMVRYFVDSGLDINFQNEEGISPLMAAAQNNRKENVKFLLQKGADPHAKNKSGQTALDIAQEKGNETIVALFKEVK